MSDRITLERWVHDRDAEAFRSLVLGYSDMVYGTCRRVLGNAAEAEDVAQECFETLAQATRVPGDYVGPWLHRVATNLSLKRIRSYLRRKKREADFAKDHAARNEIEWDDLYHFVDEAIDELPEKLRLPVVAHFLDGESHRSIAETHNVPRQTMTNRVHRGIEEIQKALKRRGISITTSALTAMFGVHLSEAAPATLAATLGKLAIAKAGSAATVGGASAGPYMFGGSVSLSKAVAFGIAIALGAALGLVLINTEEMRQGPPRNDPADGELQAAKASVLTPVETEENISPNQDEAGEADRMREIARAPAAEPGESTAPPAKADDARRRDRTRNQRQAMDGRLSRGRLDELIEQLALNEERMSVIKVGYTRGLIKSGLGYEDPFSDDLGDTQGSRRQVSQTYARSNAVWTQDHDRKRHDIDHYSDRGWVKGSVTVLNGEIMTVAKKPYFDEGTISDASEFPYDQVELLHLGFFAGNPPVRLSKHLLKGSPRAHNKVELIDGRETFVVDVKTETSASDEYVSRYWIDVHRGAMPIQIEHYDKNPDHTEATLLSRIEGIELRRLPNDAWIPIRGQRYVYFHEKDVHYSAESKNAVLSAKILINVQSITIDPSQIPESAFEIQFAHDARITDNRSENASLQ